MTPYSPLATNPPEHHPECAWMHPLKCDEDGCQDGKVPDESDPTREVDCPRCEGEGEYQPACDCWEWR